MALRTEEAMAMLFRAPHGDFVAERKRLAAEVKASGDKAGAAALGKVGRPSISAWAVNQLWWQAQPAFEALFAAAKRVRQGDFAATTTHREALASLSAKAKALLQAEGNAAADATLRRIETTLSALAATGDFAPDQPGMLAEDREALGFAAVGIVAQPGAPMVAEAPKPAAEAVEAPNDATGAEARRRADEEQRAVERQRAAEQQRAAERKRARDLASAEVERRSGEVERLRAALREAERELERASASLQQLDDEK